MAYQIVFSYIRWKFSYLRPRCVDAVSEMYIILPSGATTNMNPSSVCSKFEPSSLIVGTRVFVGISFEPHASPRPIHEKIRIFCKKKWNKKFIEVWIVFFIQRISHHPLRKVFIILKYFINPPKKIWKKNMNKNMLPKTYFKNTYRLEKLVAFWGMTLLTGWPKLYLIAV